METKDLIPEVYHNDFSAILEYLRKYHREGKYLELIKVFELLHPFKLSDDNLLFLTEFVKGLPDAKILVDKEFEIYESIHDLLLFPKDVWGRSPYFAHATTTAEMVRHIKVRLYGKLGKSVRVNNVSRHSNIIAVRSDLVSLIGNREFLKEITAEFFVHLPFNLVEKKVYLYKGQYYRSLIRIIRFFSHDGFWGGDLNWSEVKGIENGATS